MMFEHLVILDFLARPARLMHHQTCSNVWEQVSENRTLAALHVVAADNGHRRVTPTHGHLTAVSGWPCG